jgi:hypothetical protein
MPGYPSAGAAEEVQRIRDQEHLRLLVIGHYVYAGITALFSLFPLLYVGFGLLMALAPSTGPPPSGGGPPPALFGLLFAVFGGVFVVLGETLAAMNYLAGRAVKQRRSRIFVLVIDAINCLNMPLGTLLGVFTFVVLSRHSVQAEFEGGAPDEPPVPRWPAPV